MIAMTPTLELDTKSLNPAELSIPALMRELNLKKRPNPILRKLMNALEKKRQAKGLGWSRAWNKYGLNIFRTHILDTNEDAEYLAPVSPFLNSFLDTVPDQYREFARSLLSDSACMAFTFYHNNDSDDRQYEGLTLSFGRKAAEDRSKRDRLDIILEDQRIDGRVDGMADRLRIYVCPWDQYKNQRKHFVLTKSDLSLDELSRTQALYRHCIEHYHLWKNEEARQWSHWSARYIDYFGPRAFIPQGTSLS